MVPDAAVPPLTEPLLGIVFDLDGTLVLSHHDFRRMRRETIRIAEAHGVAPGRLDPERTIPELLDAAAAELGAGRASEGALLRMRAEVHRRIDAIEMEALPRTVVRPGAAALLTALADRGYRLGLLTRSSEAFARSALVRTGLGGFFDYLRSRSAPGPAKPSPEALTILLREMEVPTDRALFVGDHRLDVECAIRAGIRFVAVLADDGGPGELTEAAFRAAGARDVARDLPALGRRLGVLPDLGPR